MKSYIRCPSCSLVPPLPLFASSHVRPCFSHPDFQIPHEKFFFLHPKITLLVSSRSTERYVSTSHSSYVHEVWKVPLPRFFVQLLLTPLCDLSPHVVRPIITSDSFAVAFWLAFTTSISFPPSIPSAMLSILLMHHSTLMCALGMPLASSATTLDPHCVWHTLTSISLG